ncbi:MAG: PIN domain nuclease, partial [Deltaproteobacteria bacterium]
MSVVVDTSVWIDFFAGEPVPALEEALAQGLVVLAPIVAAELISGATREKE